MKSLLITGLRAPIAAIWCTLVLSTFAQAQSAPSPSAPATSASDVADGLGHPYDPCAIVSKSDVASAAGVAVDQVFAPARPTKNECVWAFAAHGGAPAQKVALTIQAIDQVKATHGMARFGALLNAVSNVAGASLLASPVLTRAFADAQIISGLGDRAGWKNGTLSMLKNEALYEVTATGQPTDTAALNISRAIAQSALNHTDLTDRPTPRAPQ